MLKQTDPTPIGSVQVNKITLPCTKCGEGFEVLDTSWAALKPDSFVCTPCDDKEMEDYRNAQREGAKEEKRARRLKESGIGERFYGMGIISYKPENKDAEKVLHECVEFVRNFDPRSGTNLMLIGSPGTGKNMLAAIICQLVIKKDFTALHTTALRCVRRVKDSWKHNEIDEQEVIDNFTSTDLLVIDEVGVQFGSPTELLYLTEIINDRYEKRRPTILISNLTIKQLEDILGARIMDRFYEGESKTLVFNWPSYRRKTNKEA